MPLANIELHSPGEIELFDNILLDLLNCNDKLQKVSPSSKYIYTVEELALPGFEQEFGLILATKPLVLDLSSILKNCHRSDGNPPALRSLGGTIWRTFHQTP